MRRFDPEAVRRQLLGDTGIERAKKADFEKMKTGGGLWGSANEIVGTAIRCFLCGLENEVGALLSKAEQWLKAAITLNEPSWGFPTNFREAAQYESLALCHWLESGEHDSAALAQCVDFRNRYFWQKPAELTDTYSLGEMLLSYIDGAAYEDALRWLVENGKIKLPGQPSRAKGEAAVLAVVASNRLYGSHTLEDIDRMIFKFLSSRMNEWLTSGRERHAVEWLKVACSWRGQASLPPAEVVRRAYDYLER